MGPLWFLRLFLKNESRYEEILLSVQLAYVYGVYFISLSLLTCTQKTCDSYITASYVIYVPLLLYISYQVVQRYREVKRSINTLKMQPNENTEKNKECVRKYNVSLVYGQIYLLCVVFCLQAIFTGIHWATDGGDVQNSFTWFLISILDVLPIICVKCLGRKFCFSLLAYIFEYSVTRQQEDGAFMAALISKCQVHPNDETNRQQILWIYRTEREECIKLREYKSCEVQRRFWIKGIIEKSQDQYFYVRVEYRNDTNVKLRYCYKGKTLVFEESSEFLSPLPLEFQKWIKYFEDYNPTIAKKSQVVRFWYPLTPPDSDSDSKTKRIYEDGSELIRKASEMLVWGKENLRKFHSKNFFVTTSSSRLAFREDLFTTSPRELSYWSSEDESNLVDTIRSACEDYDSSTNESKSATRREFLVKSAQLEVEEHLQTDESTLRIRWKKKELLSLSEPVVVKTRFDKVDYFISHAWADSAENKCYAVKNFIGTFSTVSRKPSFWLDKVCIDQSDTTKGIESLPINIGACKKILILMGKEYMTKLWCIWELFMLFTFCNRELGLERLQIVCIDEGIDFAKEIENFSIDNAHAFDPNEEYRLRYIMLKVVGEGKIKEIFNDLLTLVGQGKISTITSKTIRLSDSTNSV